MIGRIALGNATALADEIREVNRGNGWEPLTEEDWEDPYKVPAVLALIHSEVSKALEGWRKRDRENFAEEIADIQIRLLDLAGGLVRDLAEQVDAKIEINRTRGHRHGGKKL